ncbi:MAG: serine hydrolase [Candidatus Zixiibacteriota bacterium]
MISRSLLKRLSGWCLIVFLYFHFIAGCRDIGQELDRYLAGAHDLWNFDGAVSVSRDGRILYSRAFGLANQAMNEANTPETKFFIGSISKQFTAAAIMILHQDGLLDIDQPISAYLPSYPSESGKKITVRHLLSHTSGIPNFTDDIEILLQRTEPVSPDELIARFSSRALEFEPGTRFKYSNSGYVLLGRIIEAVSGQSYEAFLHKKIFKPAGMLNTGYGRREAAVPNRADGYTVGDKEVIVEALRVEYSMLYSSGALYSTVGDMAKWDSILYAGSILTQESIDEMTRPGCGGYGFGWFVEERFGRRHVFHGGFMDGFNATFERWPDDRLCVIVFSNEDEAPVKKMARGVAAIIFGREYVRPVSKKPSSVDPDLLVQYEGVYEMINGTYRFVTREGDTLYTHMQGEPRRTLLAQGVDTFFFASDNTKTITFSRVNGSSVTGLEIVDDGYLISTQKLSGGEADEILIDRDVVAVDPFILKRYEGTYEIQTEFGRRSAALLVEVVACGDHLVVTLHDGAAVEIFPGSHTRFFHMEADFVCNFIVDAGANVVGCSINMAGNVVNAVKVR